MLDLICESSKALALLILAAATSVCLSEAFLATTDFWKAVAFAAVVKRT
jgi:hypothetical protein